MLLAVVFLILWLIQVTGSDSTPVAAETTTYTTTAAPETTTLTATTTVTRTTAADAPAPRPSPQQTQPPSDPFPTPPGDAGPGMEWVRMGPYGSSWTCDQPRSSWPVRTSHCFETNGSWYFYGARRPA